MRLVRWIKKLWADRNTINDSRPMMALYLLIFIASCLFFSGLGFVIGYWAGDSNKCSKEIVYQEPLITQDDLMGRFIVYNTIEEPKNTLENLAFITFAKDGKGRAAYHIEKGIRNVNIKWDLHPDLNILNLYFYYSDGGFEQYCGPIILDRKTLRYKFTVGKKTRYGWKSDDYYFKLWE